METETEDKRPTQNVFEFGDFNSELCAFVDNQHNFLGSRTESKYINLMTKIEHLEKNLQEKENEIESTTNQMKNILKENFDLKEKLEDSKMKDDILEVCVSYVLT